MDSEPNLRAATLAGWSEVDLSWEQLQETAAVHAREGRPGEAAALWAKALYLARTNFEPNDPRLATSVANHAQGLRQAGDRDSADGLFRESLLIWDSSGSWVSALKIERQARSSLFHLRMELSHWAQYEATKRERLRRFANEGREALLALSQGRASPPRHYERWNGEKPPQFNDARKLLGAVFLIAPV